MSRHPLLIRQLKKQFPMYEECTGALKEQLENIFSSISQSYYDMDSDRELIERSMELSSKELFESNREIRQRNKEIQALHSITMLLQNSESVEAAMPVVEDEIKKSSAFSFVRVALVPEGVETLETAPTMSNSPDKFPKGITTPEFTKGTFISLPVIVGGRCQAHLYVACEKDGENGEKQLSYLGSVTTQLALAIEKRSLNDKVKMQEANMISAAKLSELGKMASGIAHEINNPLAMISMHASLLKEISADSVPDKARITDFTDKIVKTSDRIAKIISGLRTFSRDGTRDPLELADVQKLVDETVQFCSEKFKHSNIKLTVNIPPRLQLSCRATQISQVILNLLSNAADAISGLDEKWIKVDVEDGADTLKIFVTDSGPGIPRDIKEKIFNPFFTTKEIGKGTGLGLSVSLGIMNAHMGSLTLDDSCKNTRFVMTIPKQKSSSLPKAS